MLNPANCYEWITFFLMFLNIYVCFSKFLIEDVSHYGNCNVLVIRVLCYKIENQYDTLSFNVGKTVTEIHGMPRSFETDRLVPRKVTPQYFNDSHISVKNAKVSKVNITVGDC